MSNQINNLYEFGPFQLDPSERLLLRDGEPVALTPKAFDTLVVLVERSGRLVDKDELMNEVWQDTIVEEVGLARNISSLRKALGENANAPQYIETVPKSGYRFIAEVRQIEIENAEMIVARHTQAHIVVEEEEEKESDLKEKIIGEKILPAKSSLPFLTPFMLKIAGIVAVVLVTLTVIFFFTRNSQSPASIQSNQPLKSVAVLPFQNLNQQNKDDDYIGLGMADNLIHRLGNLRQIVVRPTSAVLRYGERKVDTVTAGRELKVDAVIEGNLQRTDDRIRLTVQLVSTRDGAILWSGKFDEKFVDVLSIQDSLCEQIVYSLTLRLNEEERKLLTKRYTQNQEAYQAYLKGLYFWNKRTQEGHAKGIEFFKKAIELDPTYALAYSGLADCYVLGGGRLPSEEAFPKARAAAMKALEIDDSIAEPHASLALVKFVYDWDFQSAEKGFKRSLELNANYPTARQWYSHFLSISGRHQEAIAEINRSQELDPLSLIILRDIGRAYYLARDYDKAIEHYKKTLEMNPNFYPARFSMGESYLQKRMYKEAIDEFQQVIKMSGERALWKAALGYAFAISGQRAEALKTLAEINAQAKNSRVPSFDIAIVYVGLGDNDKAIEFLEKAYQERSYRLIYLGIDPIFDTLRNDHRFFELIKRISLPEINLNAQSV